MARMPWCGPGDIAENEDTSSKATEVLSGLTKVKIAFFEVDPVTKAGKNLLKYDTIRVDRVKPWTLMNI